jgi:putative ABC transport system permease protein
MSGYMPRTMNVVVKSNDAAAAAAAIRSVVREIDPGAAVSGVAPMQAIINRTIAQPRLLAWTFTAFAALAVLVAGLGVYAVTAYAVGTRTAEFGVRMALGADPADVLRLVVAGSAPTILAGIVVGSASAAAAAQFLRNLLFRVEPLDPMALGTGALLISGVALLATVLPARRAARVDPLTALRE